jgi:sec-independent protein translocase protein TatA
MGRFSFPELLLILLIVVLLFGAKKIPEIAKGLGQGLKEFKNATKDEEQKADKDDKKPSPPPDQKKPS